MGRLEPSLVFLCAACLATAAAEPGAPGKTQGAGVEPGSIRIEGQVFTPEGEPGAGAAVFVSVRVRRNSGWHGGQHSLKKIASVPVDPQGRFSFERLPDASPAFHLTATHPRFGDAETRVVNEPPRTEYEARLTLAPGLSIKGRVIDSDGAPVPEACVTCYRPTRTTQTDAGGHFTLHGVTASEEGTVRCVVSKKGRVESWSTATLEEAQSGDWEITLPGERENAFSGHVSFADGSPATDMKLHFSLRRTEQDSPRMLECQVDGKGRFTCPLHSREGTDEVLSGTAWLRRRWQTPVGAVTAGQEDVELVFQNHGEIEVVVEPGNRLPPETEFWVEGHLLAEVHGSSKPAVGTAKLGPEGGRTRFTRRSPGEYEVKVAVLGARHYTWTLGTRLPQPDGSMNVTVVFRLPELQLEFERPPACFGRIRARILEPDGRTPVRKGRARMAKRWVDIRDGIIDEGSVPVGKASVEVSLPGCMPRKLWCVVREGHTRDLGDIVLVAEEDGMGWIEGRLLFDDGTPALGADLIDPGVHPFGEYPEHTPLTAQGGFRERLPVGESWLAFELGRAPRWPRAAVNIRRPGPSTNQAVRWRDRLYVPAEVEARGTVRKEITLQRSGLGTVEVHWLGDPDDKYFLYRLLVREGDTVFSCWLPNRARHRPARDWTGPVAGIPGGRRMLLVTATDYCGYQTSDAAEGASIFVVDPSRTGSIAGKVALASGKPVSCAGVELLHPLLQDHPARRGLPLTERGIDILSWVQAGLDGRYRFPRVGPGEYLVRAASRREYPPTPITVEEGKEATLDLTVLVVPKVALPLREARSE